MRNHGFAGFLGTGSEPDPIRETGAFLSSLKLLRPGRTIHGSRRFVVGFAGERSSGTGFTKGGTPA